MPDPPVGSASTSSDGRGQDSASPRADVVTPGDPDADVRTISATSSSLPRVEHQCDLARRGARRDGQGRTGARLAGAMSSWHLSLIHISEPTRRTPISYA